MSVDTAQSAREPQRMRPSRRLSTPQKRRNLETTTTPTTRIAAAATEVATPATKTTTSATPEVCTTTAAKAVIAATIAKIGTPTAAKVVAAVVAKISIPTATEATIVVIVVTIVPTLTVALVFALRFTQFITEQAATNSTNTTGDERVHSTLVITWAIILWVALVWKVRVVVLLGISRVHRIRIDRAASSAKTTRTAAHKHEDAESGNYQETNTAQKWGEREAAT